MYFKAGWVIEHKWMVFPECTLVIGKVNHSYALSTCISLTTMGGYK